MLDSDLVGSGWAGPSRKAEYFNGVPTDIITANTTGKPLSRRRVQNNIHVGISPRRSTDRKKRIVPLEYKDNLGVRGDTHLHQRINTATGIKIVANAAGTDCSSCGIAKDVLLIITSQGEDASAASIDTDGA